MQRFRQVLCGKGISSAIRSQATSFADGYPIVRRKGNGGTEEASMTLSPDKELILLVMLAFQRKGKKLEIIFVAFII